MISDLILSLDAVLPGTSEAVSRGCICPFGPPWPDMAFFHHDGHWFRPDCPVHHHAVRAEVQRIFGSAQ